MNSNKVPVVTQEPFPGWFRYEIEGQKPWFQSPVPRTLIKSSGHLSEYLLREHAKGNMREVKAESFSFKRRMGLRVRSVSNVRRSIDKVTQSRSVSFDDNKRKSKSDQTSIIKNLTRNGEVIEHQKLLTSSACNLDTLRRERSLVVIIVHVI